MAMSEGAYVVIFANRTDLLEVVRVGERGESVRVEHSALGVELRSILLRQLRPERVYRYHERAAVCLELY